MEANTASQCGHRTPSTYLFSVSTLSGPGNGTLGAIPARGLGRIFAYTIVQPAGDCPVLVMGPWPPVCRGARVDKANCLRHDFPRRLLSRDMACGRPVQRGSATPRPGRGIALDIRTPFFRLCLWSLQNAHGIRLEGLRMDHLLIAGVGLVIGLPLGVLAVTLVAGAGRLPSPGPRRSRWRGNPSRGARICPTSAAQSARASRRSAARRAPGAAETVGGATWAASGRAGGRLSPRPGRDRG